MIEAEGIRALGHSVLGITIEQLAQLALLGILDAEDGGPSLFDLLSGGHARLTGLLGGNGGQQSGRRLSGALWKLNGEF